MRLLIALGVVLVSSAAGAQTEPEHAWSDFETQRAALESATTEDCATACKALESLSRAAQHLCDVSPEHCAEAKAKVKSATERVRAACPQCDVRGETAAGQTFSSHEIVAVQSAPSHHGCAGCAIATHSRCDAGLAAAGALLLAGIGRRRRRRHDLRRVRDELRVESDPD